MKNIRNCLNNDDETVNEFKKKISDSNREINMITMSNFSSKLQNSLKPEQLIHPEFSPEKISSIINLKISQIESYRNIPVNNLNILESSNQNHRDILDKNMLENIVNVDNFKYEIDLINVIGRNNEQSYSLNLVSSNLKEQTKIESEYSNKLSTVLDYDKKNKLKDNEDLLRTKQKEKYSRSPEKNDSIKILEEKIKNIDSKIKEILINDKFSNNNKQNYLRYLE